MAKKESFVGLTPARLRDLNRIGTDLEGKKGFKDFKDFIYSTDPVTQSPGTESYFCAIGFVASN
jgi:hypothetical protein